MKRRKPIRKVSKKQRDRLLDLAIIRTRWWAEHPYMDCGICGKTIWDWFDLASDHIKPGKMGGCRDDSPENLQPAHKICNLRKGSKRPPKERVNASTT